VPNLNWKKAHPYSGTLLIFALIFWRIPIVKGMILYDPNTPLNWRSFTFSELPVWSRDSAGCGERPCRPAMD
jgi:hypothetical protein